MRKGRTEFLFLLFTLVLFFILGNIFPTNFSGCNKTETLNEPDTSFYPILRAEFEKLYNDKITGGFSGAMIVSCDGDIVFERYKSFKNRRVNANINQNSRFQLASITKQFTAVAILQLYEKGLLNLYDTVQKFIPEFPYHNITIHQLLCHRSGLPNYVYFLDKFTDSRYNSISGDSLLGLLVKNPPAIYSNPGSRFRYSNTGYVILSLIVERVTGESFHDYLRDNLFEPAGMLQTELLVPDINDNFPNMLTGYNKFGHDSREDYLNGCYGDKGVWSTARDLVLWDQALYDSVIIKNETLELALAPHGMPISSKHNYGYGWRIANYNQTSVYYHTGWWQGFKTLLMRFPENKITVVILKNTLSGPKIYQEEIVRIIGRSLSLPQYFDDKIEIDSADLLYFES